MADVDDLIEQIQEIDPDAVVAQHGPFVLTKTGALATGDPSFEQWETALLWCQKVEKYSPFWVGDMIAIGEARYGEMYAQAMDSTGQAYGTLMNAVYVAKAVSHDRRRPGLPFGLHQEVAPLPPAQQEQWLERAETESLTQAQLRHEIKLSKANDAGTAVELWLLVKCQGAADQHELAERMKDEGRAVKLHMVQAPKEK